ncbi:hypothetical protein I79_004003 [Cricetulus griseus]|uniref:Uncharacterized protein n=1 Tax=Cricetulus griseus TaxID=10029 RepID=G3H1H7_CRIGR|nr:hypothetical protein I79_004003 [Cricetulus griseus]
MQIIDQVHGSSPRFFTCWKPPEMYHQLVLELNHQLVLELLDTFQGAPSLLSCRSPLPVYYAS